MTTKSKVAIIGLGNIGKTIAQNTVKGNRPVYIASRKKEDATALAQELGNLATPSDTADAIKNADIIVLSVWFNTIQELFEKYGVENPSQSKLVKNKMKNTILEKYGVENVFQLTETI